jgi:predicted small secreted protein
MKAKLLLLLLPLAAVLSSCNTTIGLGRDMRILGESMESQANKARGNEDAGAPIY